ncbi:hypothetical protein HK102_013779 [Quaeritorhiza haematococci]|nr:hypothetical protein HK102_013779 [Quaeritorhiza haematococci]
MTFQQKEPRTHTAFKQQRLKAWQPILTPKTVLPLFFAIGVVFIPLGIGLFIASEKVSQVIFDYTNCDTEAPKGTYGRPSTTSYGPIREWLFDDANRVCSVRFEVPSNFAPPVFMYYRLTNFFQNHRRYVKSFDANQLKGDIIENPDSLQTSCDPLKKKPSNLTYPDGFTPDPDAQYYPCGLIANSFFTDQFSGLYCVEGVVDVKGNNTNGPITCRPELVNNRNQPGDVVSYTFAERGIAWPSDTEKFRDTKWRSRPDQIRSKLIPPDQWREQFPEWRNGYNASNLPNLQTWERFQVWMRTAGLPNFRKLYGRNDDNTLPAATWQINITDKFDVRRYGGTKSVVISTVSILGGKNPFLGISYLVVGSLCILLGVVFLLRHLVKPRYVWV